MSQKLLVNDLKQVEDFSDFDESFIKSYNEESDEVYFLEVDLQFPKKFHDLHNDLPFLLERLKIEKGGKLVANLHDKNKYVIHMSNFKQALKHATVLKKIHRVIKFNQKAWLKPYIDKNTDLGKAAKNDFEKDFFKLANNSVFGKTMENV